MRRLPPLALAAVVALAACAAQPPAQTQQTLLAGQAVNMQALTADEVARAVQITPRGQQVFFQAPPLQASKLIDLRAAGKEMGLSLGTVERVRLGYLFGVLDRPSGAVRHHVLFQSNFVEGSQRYASVTLADGTALAFTVSRAADPCVPPCYPVVEALIAEIPDATLRAQAATGLPLFITLDTGQVISTPGSPAYVEGYLQALDAYRRTAPASP